MEEKCIKALIFLGDVERVPQKSGEPGYERKK